MQHYWLVYILTFIFSFTISLICTPYSKKISIRVGAIDLPKERGMHKEPIPRMGGLAIVTGFIGTMLILSIFVEYIRTIQFLGFLIGAIIIVILGIFDDIYNVKPRVKLAFQIIVALIVIFTGTKIELINLPFNISISAFNIPITLIWIVGITNAVNLIDGLDGLAAGVSSIIALTLSVVCLIYGSFVGGILTICLAGSCFGFLPRNFSPAEIIMGDTGALFLGYVLAVTSIMGVYKTYTVLAFAICGFALALPIFDTLFAMIRRVKNGKHIMEADRGHLHHRLIDAGFSPSQAVTILYLISGFCGIIAILIAISNPAAIILSILLLTVISTMLYVYRKRIDKSNKLHTNMLLEEGSFKELEIDTSSVEINKELDN